MDSSMKVSVCNRRTDRKFKNQEQTWDYLVNRNRTPIRTSETIQEYPKLPKEQRDALKDVGGFIGGWLKGGSRKNGNVLARGIGTLDADHIADGPAFLAALDAALDGVQYFLYSTHSHTPEAPRYRIIILFAREVREDEYPALIPAAEEAQREAMEVDERQGMVEEYLEALLPEGWDAMDVYSRRNFITERDSPVSAKGSIRRDAVSNAEIWCECFGRQLSELKPADSYAIAALMTQVNGWERTKLFKRLPFYGKQRIYRRTRSNPKPL